MKSIKNFWGKLKSKCNEVGIKDIITLIIWTYLIFKFKFIRDFILGIFKTVGFIWTGVIVFVAVMLVAVLALYIITIIGMKAGVIDKEGENFKFKK